MLTKQINDIITTAMLTVFEEMSEREAVERLSQVLSESAISERVSCSIQDVVKHIVTLKQAFRQSIKD